MPGTRDGKYEQFLVFCKSVNGAREEANNYVLPPGSYFGASNFEDDGVSFEEKIADLTSNLKKQFEETIALQ
jgi:type I restriction enzyme M protein